MVGIVWYLAHLIIFNSGIVQVIVQVLYVHLTLSPYGTLELLAFYYNSIIQVYTILYINSNANVLVVLISSGCDYFHYFY